MFRNLAIITGLILIFSSCRKDAKLLSDPGTLNFSADTVYFDTVFTRLPGTNYPRSVNKRIMVRNPYKEKVIVNVNLMGGTNSPFRFNIDGLTGRRVNGVEILPKDSAWVFVEASLDANNALNPALVRDSIEFETNGNRQYLQLAAYGWDAYYFKDTVFKGTTNLILKDKPYVIVNAVYVDNGATLNIGPGTHFYATPNAVFVDTANKKYNISSFNIFGTLNINGTKTDSVVFEGDRLDNTFQNKAGQWRGFHFYRGSINNTIQHAVIKNATVGIWVDSLPESGSRNLIIKNTTIKNMSAYGVLGLTAAIAIENSVIANCGANTFIGYYGGDYLINNCTFYNGANGRRDPHVIFNNILRNDKKQIIRTFDISFNIQNSILWGPLDTEFGTDLTNDSKVLLAGLSFSLYKSKTDLGGTSNIRSKDPLFQDVSRLILQLKAGSPAIGKANPLTATLTDYHEKSRDASPDMGAFEF